MIVDAGVGTVRVGDSLWVHGSGHWLRPRRWIYRFFQRRSWHKNPWVRLWLEKINPDEGYEITCVSGETEVTISREQVNTRRRGERCSRN